MIAKLNLMISIDRLIVLLMAVELVCSPYNPEVHKQDKVGTWGIEMQFQVY